MTDSHVFDGLARKIEKIIETEPNAVVIGIKPGTTFYTISHTRENELVEARGYLRRKVKVEDVRSFLAAHIPKKYRITDTTIGDNNRVYFSFVPSSEE